MGSRRARSVFATITLTVVSLAVAAPRAAAQVLYGSIVGTVRDATNAAVPGAAVRITNTATNTSRDSLSNESGEYSFPSLESGSYDVTVTKDGFQTFTTKGLRVDLDQTTRLDAVLKVGAVSESVVVSADATVLQTDSAEVRAEVSSVQLEDLPIPINRNYESLLIEIPGMTPPENATRAPRTRRAD